MGYVFDGVYMTEEEFNSQPKHASSEIGTVRMKDVSGPNGVPDGIIDNNDRVKIGDPNPDFIYGMTNEFSWKNFDLSILISGQVGGDIINSNYEHTLNIDGCFNVLKKLPIVGALRKIRVTDRFREQKPVPRNYSASIIAVGYMMLLI